MAAGGAAAGGQDLPRGQRGQRGGYQGTLPVTTGSSVACGLWGNEEEYVMVGL